MTEAEQEQTAEAVKGLRALADFMERTDHYLGTAILVLNTWIGTKDELAKIATILAPVEKVTHDNASYFWLKRKFSSNVCIEVNVNREQVCEKIITQRVVPSEPEKVIPAKPERIEEVVSWECPDSILRQAEPLPM